MQAVVALAARATARTVDQQLGFDAGSLEPGRDRQGDARCVVLSWMCAISRPVPVTEDRGQPIGQNVDLHRLAKENRNALRSGERVAVDRMRKFLELLETAQSSYIRATIPEKRDLLRQITW